MTRRWLFGVIKGRPGRLLGAALGVAVTTALLCSLGIFLSKSTATMTSRAAADVPIDWQVQLSAAANEGGALAALQGTAAVAGAELVEYHDVAGFTARTSGTSQVTGRGKVVGLGPRYLSQFPGVLRQLAGTSGGVELSQQTAANLRAAVGDRVTIRRFDGTIVDLVVDGVVAEKKADSFFQAIGVAPGAAPAAPPDNVVYLPDRLWRSLFPSPSANTSFGMTGQRDASRQFHVSIDATLLPRDPASAYSYLSSLANNLEARSSGTLTVADNLAQRFGAVRADALYAKVLFLFLGLPGAALSLLITLSIMLTGSQHISREQSLLRVRGATARQVFRFELAEAAFVGLVGIVVGLGLTAIASHTFIGSSDLLSGTHLIWMLVSSLAVATLIVCAIAALLGARLRRSAKDSSQAVARSNDVPLWQRLFWDILLVAAGLLTYWLTAQKGYEVVLAPEGTPSVSVHYEAFVAPLLFWLGGALLGLRLFEALIGDRRAMRRLLRPVSSGLAPVVAASLGRQRRLLARGVVMVGLAVAFAVSTSVFNTTYNAQARVDAQLTNGADITVTGNIDSPAGGFIPRLLGIRGVAAVEPMMHRFVYVGSDLQDLYGIDPKRIRAATAMSDAYFAGGDAVAALSMLSSKPSGVLVSEETKNDYQLSVGDTINLRLQFAGDHRYYPVPFVFMGVVREFPTAPKDSFIVANSSYIAARTGIVSQEIALIRADEPIPQVKSTVDRLFAGLPGMTVSDIQSTQAAIDSSLTSVDLRGLTRLELAFAILAVIGSAGLIIALGLRERRRSFALLEAVGASRRQLRAFVWSEVLLVIVSGIIIGAALGMVVAATLVNILHGVFDPPPPHLYAPLGYLVALLAAVAASCFVGAASISVLARQSLVEEIRKL